MLEALGPIVTLFSLVLKGLKKTSLILTDKKLRAIQRKIIEIQISLEKICEIADEILLFIFEQKKHPSLSEETIKNFEHLVYIQRNQIYKLTQLLNDEDAEELMKLFTPKIRRDLMDFIHIKGGFLNDIIQNLSLYYNLKIENEKITIRMDRPILKWDENKFNLSGRAYFAEHSKKNKTHNIEITNNFEIQKEIVDKLKECSNEFSVFIRSQIDLNDFFKLK